MKNVLFLVIILLSNSMKADDFPKIFGCFCEGGLITGKVKKNDELEIDNKKIEIFDEGVFIYAFGRKYNDSVSISHNGKKRKFKVLNKKYKIENIKGLPQKKVDPSKDDLLKIKSDRSKINKSKKMGKKQKLFSDQFILPVNGRLSGFFGSQRILNSKPRSPHNGIDIAQKEGAPIISPSKGVVKLVSKNMFFTGNTVILDHGLGLISIFAHMKEIFVREGQQLDLGDLVGEVGMSGRATGPHLHWGVYLLNKPVDPLSLVESSFF